MSEPLAYLGGRLIAQAEARLELHDAGFVFGATVTDLCRTFRHQLYRLDEHLHRFRQSCQLARIQQSLSNSELGAIAQQLAAHNASQLRPDRDLALVLFATPGPIGYYAGLPGGPGDGPPTLGMHTFPLPMGRFRRFFTEGARLYVPALQGAPVDFIDPHIKQRSRLHWWLADREAHDKLPGAIPLLRGSDGFVTETAAANFLIVRQGTVLTPRRATVLNGISLMTVEELCRQLEIPFQEQDLDRETCLAADEALLSNTSYCLAPVQTMTFQNLVTNETARFACPGPTFEKLLAAWSRQVGLDIRGQILADG